jgi:hypothetical protein
MASSPRPGGVPELTERVLKTGRILPTPGRSVPPSNRTGPDASWSSPRSWGCSAGREDHARTAEVLPTLVGVFRGV